MRPSKRHSKGNAICAFVVVLGLATPAWAADFAGGAGKPNDPYQIATAQQLAAIGADSSLLGQCFVLIDDIDLDPNLPGGRVFGEAPIAPDRPYTWGFTGTFDGAGHTVRNLVVQAPKGGFLGLFGRIGERGRVHDLAIKDARVTGQENVAALAGKCHRGTIERCGVTARVQGDRYVGGLVGGNSGTVICSYSDGEVQGNRYVGGLAGYAGGRVEDSYSTARVSGQEGIGGLAGTGYGAAVICCYAAGSVSGSKAVGGLIGTEENPCGVFLSYWDMEASGVATSIRGWGRSSAQMMDAATLRGWGYGRRWTIDAGRDYPRLAWEHRRGQPVVDAPRTYGGGSGTLGAPYRISTPEHLCTLAWYRADHDKYFVLTADLDFSAASSQFFPIGLRAMPFTGVFDGNDRTISHLRYASDEDCVALFSAIRANRPSIRVVRIAGGNEEQTDCAENCTGQKGCIANLRLEDVDIEGHDNVGALVGYNSGTICGCSVEGSVRGWSNVGGLAGNGQIDARVCHCQSACRVQGQASVGGLVGYTQYGVISTSNTSGDVHGQEDVGGLVGNSGGIVTSCYSEAHVTGENKVGGIAGWNRYSNITCSYACALVAGTSQVGGAVGLNGGKVSYCYAAGPVDGKTQVGGLIGARYSNSEAYLSYWDLQTTGQSMSAGGAGKTTEEMKALSTFRGWGTSEAWRMDDGRDYPRLIWEMTPGVPMADVHWLYEGGTGEPNDPFQISTADHLTAIAYHPEDLDKHFVLTADIDLSKIDANGIVPIGDTITPFTGVFDGRGHVIRGLRRVWEGGIRTGLFGVIQTPGWLLRDDPLERLLTACAAGPSASNLGILRGCVMNLHLRDVDVRGGDTVGALAGRCWGIILCCSVDGQVRGTGRAGGLVGYSEGYVIACQSTGYVTAEAIAGGLLGGTAGPVLCCHSSASVQAGKTAGGLVGNNAGHVAWCLSTGPVSATEEPGGLCGAAANGSVYLSYWDVETSGCRLSQGGRGRTPEQLRDLRTYRGWGYSGLWRTPDGMDHPQLVWENVTGQVITDEPRYYGAGTGSADDPYQIWSVEDFIALGYYPEDFDRHFILVSDLDLSDADPNALLPIGTPILPFTGVFDGDNSSIYGLTYPHPGESCIGVFGSVLASDAGGPVGGAVRNLLVQDIDIAGGDRVGGLVGVNRGSLTDCHVTGRINGRDCVGGLVGANQEDGSILHCTCNIALEADTDVGGLVGYNDGSIEASCARGFVTGHHNVGGLLGNNGGTVAQTFADAKVKGGGRIGGLAGQSYGGSILWSYSQGTVDGDLEGPTVGGLIGYNYDVVSHCYSACRIRGDTYASLGGLIGMDWWGEIESSFWDTDISGARRGVGRPDPYPGGVTGLSTPRMQTAATFIGAGWDFIDETENGTEDIWMICEGRDYPRLWWEEVECEP